ncbi:hypothetical protein SELR_21610 [Selenomonas ruminantium subsp. lactilytica TAM6421]|uniref:Cyclic nucleotide-binding domain-containing protein n=1 Tax=Selenomonas ruminantium subsp. lactilytica (strain NBRC 103574 / TAM6421) TaxID=927704 RepID=I0GSY2_SELRL|nr:Crp/Fnr family transcriptional regulator [Selenomonas ruminantium]BAL83869.1 hypothetical protein SELR_21610 [Selenomonas ruminantium subsp. lactilytica TAM6421]
MGKIDIAKGQFFHRKGDEVKDIALILKGSFTLNGDADISFTAHNGAIIGAFYQSGDKYHYDYQAAEDCTLFVYDYNDEDDLSSAISATPAIAPVMATASIALLNNMLETLDVLYDDAINLCEGLKNDYCDYKNICTTLMIPPQKFDHVNDLLPPGKPAMLTGWQTALCHAFQEKNDLLRKECYPADVNFCIGAVMLASQLAQQIHPQLDFITGFIKDAKAFTNDFTSEYRCQKSKLDEAQRQEAMEAGSGNIPKIENALHTILAFAGLGHELDEVMAKDIRAFMKAPDKTEKSAEMRRLRGDITKNFFTIYEAAFFKSLEADTIPAEVKMFFLFGFIDEELAGEENTATLYRHAVLWEDDKNGMVIPAYDWLKKIYLGEVPPSKDEFDNDWPDHLKEEVRQGNLKQAEADNMLEDTTAMVRFELQSMIASANKMTYGSIFSYIPAFYAQVVSRPLDTCLSTAVKITKALNHIRSIDYSCFYRPAYASYPELKINRFDYNKEVLPYIILMPNYGSRGLMWQEIEGRRRTTPSHMVLSIFHSEDIESTLIKMCAQFRWEMCKRIQGVRYSDVTEPSLTAEYCNYLQFYKKNSTLSADMKEKVKGALKRWGNSYSKVFAAEYEQFVKNESEGLPRLNKVAREILFKYCTFGREYRDALSINPQYKPLIDRWNIAHDDKVRTLDLFARRILGQVKELPEEVQLEKDFLKL